MKGVAQIYIVIGIVAILAIAASQGLLPLGILIPGGLDVISIDSTNIQVNSGVPQGYFLITVAATGGSESVYGTISPDMFESMSGYRTSDSFTITLSSITETARYQVDNLQQPIYKVYPAWPEFAMWEIDWTNPFCGIDGYPNMEMTHWTRNPQAGVMGDLDLPSILSEVTINANDEMVYITNEQTSGAFSFGNVQWIGGLSTGNFAPDPNDYVPTFPGGSGDWRIATRGGAAHLGYQNSWSSLHNALNSWVSVNCGDMNQVRAAITNHNYVADGFLNTDESFWRGFTWENRNDPNQARLNYVNPYRQFNPVLVFHVDASEVGILVSTGIPRINNVVADEFHSGDLNGNLRASVTNIGEAPGSFDFSLEVCSNFDTSYAITGQAFSPAETRIINVPIRSVGAGGETTETCILKVCDSSGYLPDGTPGQSCDEMAVTIHMLEAEFCTEGEQGVEQRCIYVCSNNEWTEQECCIDNLYPIFNSFTGTYSCQEFGSEGGDCTWGDVFSIPPDFTCLWALILTVLIIAFIIFMVLSVIMLLIPFTRGLWATMLPLLIILSLVIGFVMTLI